MPSFFSIFILQEFILPDETNMYTKGFFRICSQSIRDSSVGWRVYVELQLRMRVKGSNIGGDHF